MLHRDEFAIVDAQEENLAQINALIARSKSHWNWPEEYLRHALPLHRLSAPYLKRAFGYEVWTDARILVAFFSLDASGARPLIDNLWVLPEFIGRGVGKAACTKAFELARHFGWPELFVMPDPPSEGFYATMGFTDTGERVPSRVVGGPVFSVHKIQISTTGRGT